MRTLQWLALLLFIVLLITPAVRAQEDDDDEVTVEKSLKGAKVPLKTDDEVVDREEQAMSRDGYSIEEQKQMRSQSEKFQFQTEVNRMMSIIINSLYSNQEIFLRELISNSSDALDKIRFLALTNPSLLGEGDQAKLEIKVQLDKENNTITISDTGIGMTKADLIRNLGTIAQSGTKEFLEKFAEGGASTSSSLIGQFGVGFYSAFLVADHVTVTSKHNEDDQYIWTSEADGSYTVVKDPHGNTMGRGTRIVLHLKDEALEFLDESRIRTIAKKYSEFINFPIFLWASHTEEKEVPIEEETEPTIDEDETISVHEEEDDEGEDLPKTKKVSETVWDWERLNHTQPIWTRNPKDITEREYLNFYKSLTQDAEDPMKYIHFAAEGDAEFKSILYIPKNAPHNMFDPNASTHRGAIKLYVRRVFITDEFEGIIPNYLKFIRGVVDSDDLPLNVSREILQQNKLLKQIEKKLVRKSIAMFQELASAEDKSLYKNFWENYGVNVKLGVIEDAGNRSRLSKLLMFLSSKTGDYVSLDDYISRMKEGQDQIYYLAGSSKDAVEKSPLIERAIKKGYEVLYMVDPIDEYTTQHLHKYDNKFKLTNLGKEGVKFDEDDTAEEDDKKKVEAEYQPLVDYLKDSFSDKIDKVVITDRLTTSPCALVSSSYGYSANMERIMKAQALGTKSSGGPYSAKKILEINPKHPILKELLRRVAADKDDETAKVTATVLYETAVLSSGYSIDDPSDFAGWIHRMMSLNLNINPTEHVEEEVEHTETTKTSQSKDEL